MDTKKNESEQEQLKSLYNTFFTSCCTFEKFQENVSLEFLQAFFAGAENDKKLFTERIRMLTESLKNL